MNKELWIWDLETYPNFFLATFKNKITGKWFEFEISDRYNDLDKLRIFLLNQCQGLIGFNNINFDYPVIHNSILKNNNIWTSYDIYEEVEKIIANKYSAIWDNQIIIPQLDLYRIWHYDNKNKSCSLKWLEFAMRWSNLQELPYAVGSILTFEEMDNVRTYCRNDINATEQFYLKSLKHISLRQFYTNQEGINMMNASEIRMSKDIFGKYLAKEMKISVKELNQMRTHRKEIDIKDIIFDYIKFNNPINQQTLDNFKNFKWQYNEDTEKAFENIKFSVPYENVVREYAEGGLHSFGKAGIYESDNEWELWDFDFASFYPHISFRNNLHPEHIPEPIFSTIYEGFYKDRKLYDKKDPRNYVLKIILNGSYGLSKDKYAFLYDPKWQLAICINGQLLLTLLTERIVEACKIKPTIIFENTDGCMIRIHKSDINKVKEACKQVETICNIPLEAQLCEKIIALNVNNYINIISDDNIKFKGCFEIDRDYHKNHSKRIVPIALGEYFINNKSIEETIFKHITMFSTNSDSISNIDNSNKHDISFYENYGIYDFCIGGKMKGDNKLYARSIQNFKVIDEPIGKINRYYISDNGTELIKKLPPLEKNGLTATDKYKAKIDQNQMNIFDIIENVKIEPSDREENLEAGWKCQLFNIFKEDEYNINFKYYINECKKTINIIENGR